MNIKHWPEQSPIKGNVTDLDIMNLRLQIMSTQIDRIRMIAKWSVGLSLLTLAMSAVVILEHF